MNGAITTSATTEDEMIAESVKSIVKSSFIVCHLVSVEQKSQVGHGSLSIAQRCVEIYDEQSSKKCLMAPKRTINVRILSSRVN